MTNGMVVIVQRDKVAAKVVVGCDGYNAKELADAIKARRFGVYDFYTLGEIEKLANAIGFGCKECRVVMNKNFSIHSPDWEEHPNYKNTFDDTTLNPRFEDLTVRFSEDDSECYQLITNP